jgi:anti-sigma B factor antagonist
MGTALATGRVEVGVDGARIAMRMVGHATHRLCQPVQEFAMAMVSVGYRRFEIDLGVCTHMDSTFIGVLAGLAIKVAPDGGSVTLLRVPPACSEAIATLGVQNLFSTRPESYPQLEVISMRQLPLEPKSFEAWACMVLEAHELLSRANPSNRQRLREVLAYLMDSRQPVLPELPPRGHSRVPGAT